MFDLILWIVVAASFIYFFWFYLYFVPDLRDLGLYTVSDLKALDGITGWQVVYKLWPIAAVLAVAAASLSIIAGWWFGRWISELERSEASAARQRFDEQERKYRLDYDRARRDALESVQRERTALSAAREEIAAERDTRLEAVLTAEDALRQRQGQMEGEIARRVSAATQGAQVAQCAADARAAQAEAQRDEALRAASAARTDADESRRSQKNAQAGFARIKKKAARSA
jgi:hypothetical protein